MANRRMFSKDITDSDVFTSLKPAAQALYFHLNQGADDDGLNNQVRTAMGKAHAGPQDLRLLVQQELVIQFTSGIVAVRHWRLHNVLRKDRYIPSTCSMERKQLWMCKDGTYTLEQEPDAVRLPDGCQLVALGQDRSGKVRSGKDRLGKDRSGKPREPEQPSLPGGPGPEPPELILQMPSLDQVRQYCRERGNSVDPQRWHNYYTANGFCIGGEPIRDWKAAVRAWERKECSGGFLDIMEELDE